MNIQLHLSSELDLGNKKVGTGTYSRPLVLGILTGCILVTSIGISHQATATESQRLYRSAYYLGRGDTGIAIADNHEAIFYNPAGLATGKGIYKETVLASPMIEVSTATKDLARKVALEESVSPLTLAEEMGKNQHVGLYNFSGIVFRRVAFGAALSTQTNLLPKLSAEQRGVPKLAANQTANQAITFSIAEQFFSKNFRMGVTGKYLIRSTAAVEVELAEAETAGDSLNADDIAKAGSGGGGDFGLMWTSDSKKSPFSFGLTVQNIGDLSMSPIEDGGSAPDPLKQVINVGFALEPGVQHSKIRLLLDLRDVAGNEDENRLKGVHIGAEITIRNFIGLSTGFNQGYATFGAYLDLHVLRIDFGSYTEEVGTQLEERPDQRFFGRLVMGF